MPNNQFPHPFGDWLKTYRRERAKLPVIIGQEAVNFFKDSFRNQGFTGDTLDKWKKRKNNKDSGRAILIKSAKLRNSIRTVRAELNLVVVGSNLPYAEVHNSGFRGTVNVKPFTRKNTRKMKVSSTSLKTKRTTSRIVKVTKGKINVGAHTRKMNMPKRQFIGNSQYLDRKIERHISALFLKTFRS